MSLLVDVIEIAVLIFYFLIIVSLLFNFIDRSKRNLLIALVVQVLVIIIAVLEKIKLSPETIVFQIIILVVLIYGIITQNILKPRIFKEEEWKKKTFGAKK